MKIYKITKYMEEIKYVYPLYETRGVGAHNIEQDLYGAVKSAPKYAAMGVGVLGAIGFSKIKRMLKFRKAKQQITNGSSEILADIEKWHELNDNKLAKICEVSVENYKTQTKLLKKQYTENKKYISKNGGAYQEPSPQDKKAQVDKITSTLTQQLKLKFEEYNKGLNAWSVGKMRNYTENIFSNLKDDKLTKKYQALSQANAINSVERKKVNESSISDAVSKNYVTSLSKKQIKTLEGLWLKELMQINAKAADITNKCIETIKNNYFGEAQKDTTIAALANVLEFDGPKGFMTSESLDEIKSYIDDITGSFRFVDKKMIDSVSARMDNKQQPMSGGENTNDGFAEQQEEHQNESTKAMLNFKNRLLESRDRIKK